MQPLHTCSLSALHDELPAKSSVIVRAAYSKADQPNDGTGPRRGSLGRPARASVSQHGERYCHNYIYRRGGGGRRARLAVHLARSPGKTKGENSSSKHLRIQLCDKYSGRILTFQLSPNCREISCFALIEPLASCMLLLLLLSKVKDSQLLSVAGPCTRGSTCQC